MEISALPLFRGIPAEELPTLLVQASAKERRFQKTELLLRRGDVTGRLGLVLEGSVHIIREDFWGNRSIVGLAGPGEVFAESYALAGEPLSVSVLAASDGAALFLDAEKEPDAHWENAPHGPPHHPGQAAELPLRTGAGGGQLRI